MSLSAQTLVLRWPHQFLTAPFLHSRNPEKGADSSGQLMEIVL